MTTIKSIRAPKNNNNVNAAIKTKCPSVHHFVVNNFRQRAERRNTRNEIHYNAIFVSIESSFDLYVPLCFTLSPSLSFPISISISILLSRLLCLSFKSKNIAITFQRKCFISIRFECMASSQKKHRPSCSTINITFDAAVAF